MPGSKFFSNLSCVFFHSSSRRACYADGAMVPIKEGATTEPKAAAGTDGTTITVRGAGSRKSTEFEFRYSGRKFVLQYTNSAFCFARVCRRICSHFGCRHKIRSTQSARCVFV